MARGTPIVRDRPQAQRKVSEPSGTPLYLGDRAIVDAWNRRAVAQGRSARAGLVALSALAAVATAAGLAPVALFIVVTGTAAVVYPILALEAASRAAQRPIEIFEEGVRATEKRRLLRFRRFTTWPELAHGQVRELAPGRFQMVFTLLNGDTLESVPGEVGLEALTFVNERTGQQLRGLPIEETRPANSAETLS